MEMSKPGPAHARFAAMAGNWTGEEKLHPSPFAPEGGTAEARLNNRVALGGFVLIQDYAQSIGGHCVFEGHGVFAWDLASERYVMHWCDSMGMPPGIFTGDFSGTVLTMTAQAAHGHTRATWNFTGDSATFFMEVSQDGQQWFPMMEGRYRRLSAQSAQA